MELTFICPRCGMPSAHPMDVREGYCGACHDWTGDWTGYCTESEDHRHCRHWWGGGPCCRCAAGAMDEAEQRELGMIE